MKILVFSLIVVLAIIHQDFWWWDRIDPLVFGFVPIGLAYQAGVSLAAGILWMCAVKYCWPAGMEEDEPTSGSRKKAKQRGRA